LGETVVIVRWMAQRKRSNWSYLKSMITHKVST
jgi:hypothetical protein